MLKDNYNFRPYSLNPDDEVNHASGHVSSCIKYIDEQLHTYLENNKIKPKREVGNKINQFKKLDRDNQGLVDLMKKLVHLRNAFQHGKPDPDSKENQQYILLKEERIKLDNEVMQNFQKDYITVHNWLIVQNQGRRNY